jgi:pyruvate/2-oxoglutarate dehydrogenase complex dihydrolipoamide dehydrogenase (E3) component
MVVHGAGRVPDINDLMLGNAGIAHSDKGITVDHHMATGISHLYAVAYKIMVGENRQILVAHVLSDYATGLINSVALAMVSGINVDYLYQYSIMTPYPTRESDLLYMLKPLTSPEGADPEAVDRGKEGVV